jgi:hypothetical protein
MFDFKVVSKKAKKIERNKPKVDSVEVVLTDEYNPIAVHSFEEISDFLIYSKGPETIISDISESINRIESKDVVDIVFAIDATGSMKDDIEKLKHEWIPILKDDLKKFGDRMLETNIIHYLNTIIIYIPKYIVSHESPIYVFKIIHCTQFYES